ncbi:MAG: hypothetical protein A3E07_00355 [Candidatus Wildermuthbacteria bacterium RIFCSPHIGHO2_12_FULL_45_9]|uniref:Phosphoesterase HXTX domain-containing protein n=1 Tax=Candidatus Wildermuthbacteria bacterium RIFCSPHIGHO2_02_FULL_45_25 TaxID=1802450 RepID=A0A1G2R1R5_9BACT|nr:MAG: hypothetical protein A3C04_03605 [Candidatus Wildermuthbacteria bacterium RIFCSPHIGHO2_02_FULL_45_25]OHA71214.1 MAG: hypothetical protein A3E07_00355 [Candidatus Wildermuthbacteria bacterium RIFCSPHIGHO2_12_FULL_45_9]
MIPRRLPLTVHYPEWLFNSAAVVAAGIPTQSVFDLTQKIIRCAKERGIELRSPWGSHITVSRFTGPMPPSQIAMLVNTIETLPPLGQSKLQSIQIGYFLITRQTFEHTVYAEFQL